MPAAKRCYFAQLTLFPRVSKTSETNLGYGLAILREHFFKHRFFKDDKLVILTLMKGDEGVETGKESANSALLGNITRKSNSQIMYVISVKSGYATARSKTFKTY